MALNLFVLFVCLLFWFTTISIYLFDDRCVQIEIRFVVQNAQSFVAFARFTHFNANFYIF